MSICPNIPIQKVYECHELPIDLHRKMLDMVFHSVMIQVFGNDVSENNLQRITIGYKPNGIGVDYLIALDGNHFGTIKTDLTTCKFIPI